MLPLKNDKNKEKNNKKVPERYRFLLNVCEILLRVYNIYARVYNIYVCLLHLS